MDIFITTFEAVIILIGTGAIGFYIIARKILPEEIMSVIPPLVIDIALPCLVFSNIIKGFSPEKHTDWWMLPLVWAGFTIILLILTLSTSIIAGKEFRQEFRVSLFYQNGLFIPLAVLSGMKLADSGIIVDLFLFTIIYPAFFFNTYHFFFMNSKKKPSAVKENIIKRYITKITAIKINKSVILNPILIATTTALILKLTPAYRIIPDAAISITELVGRMTIPLIMIIIGGTIYIDFRARGKIHISEIIKFIALKNFFFPLCIIGIICLFSPDRNTGLILLLQSAAPPISAVPIVTGRAGKNRGIVNQFVAASFLCSAVSVPVMIWLYSLVVRH